MNYIDIIIIIILAFSAIAGFTNGFVKEAASLAAFVLGVWGAFKYSSFTAQKLYEFFDMSGQYTGIVAFVITFLVIVVAIHFVGQIINKIINVSVLGLFNMILGGILGFLKSLLFLSVFFLILNVINVKRPFLPKEKIEQSALYNQISDIIPALFPIISEEFFKQKADKVKNSPSGGTLI